MLCPGCTHRGPIDALAIPEVLLILNYINMSRENTLLRYKSHTYPKATKAETVNRMIPVLSLKDPSHPQQWYKEEPPFYFQSVSHIALSNGGEEMMGLLSPLWCYQQCRETADSHMRRGVPTRKVSMQQVTWDDSGSRHTFQMKASGSKHQLSAAHQQSHFA